jgi:hypothetical protein
MRFVMIKYQDDEVDVVKAALADKLISAGKIKQFYRGSEHRWITLGIDPVRGKGGHYAGPDRRVLQLPGNGALSHDPAITSVLASINMLTEQVSSACELIRTQMSSRQNQEPYNS